MEILSALRGLRRQGGHSEKLGLGSSERQSLGSRMTPWRRSSSGCLGGPSSPLPPRGPAKGGLQILEQIGSRKGGKGVKDIGYNEPFYAEGEAKVNIHFKFSNELFFETIHICELYYQLFVSVFRWYLNLY